MMGIKELQRIIVLALWEAEMEGTRTDSGEIMVREPDGSKYVIIIT